MSCTVWWVDLTLLLSCWRLKHILRARHSVFGWPKERWMKERQNCFFQQLLFMKFKSFILLFMKWWWRRWWFFYENKNSESESSTFAGRHREWAWRKENEMNFSFQHVSSYKKVSFVSDYLDFFLYISSSPARQSHDFPFFIFHLIFSLFSSYEPPWDLSGMIKK